MCLRGFCRNKFASELESEASGLADMSSLTKLDSLEDTQSLLDVPATLAPLAEGRLESKECSKKALPLALEQIQANLKACTTPKLDADQGESIQV